jgi:murein L,D-transpeptidase YcbB/YkuD
MTGRPISMGRAIVVALALVLFPTTGARTQDLDTERIVAAFHAARGDAPAWTEERTPPTLNARGEAVVQALNDAGREALAADDYAVAEGESAGDLERAVTASLVNYLVDLQTGRIAPQRADPDLFVYRRDVDAQALLEAVASAPDPARTIADLAPANPIYRRLRRLLAEYRTIEGAGGWNTVAPGETLKPGMTDPRVGAVRRRLAATRDLTLPDEPSNHYDPTLEIAVRAFQRRHGLIPDGAIGKRTIAALNVTVEERIRQIELNMERFRWIPDELGDDHVFVNLAGFVLDYVRKGTTRLTMRVIVGRQYRETPTFSDRIRYLEFNPTWTVPPKIAIEDLLPKIRKDSGFLPAGGYEVFKGWQEASAKLDPAAVDWTRVGKGNFPYRLVQRPGDQNALGRVKFMFPNRFDVYLHDTPARALFHRPVRTFSSGCIRLERPLALAEALLEADGQDAGRIKAILEAGATTRVNLGKPVPVHLAYLTAWIGEGGTVEFRDDVYGRDALLAKALGL